MKFLILILVTQLDGGSEINDAGVPAPRFSSPIYGVCPDASKAPPATSSITPDGGIDWYLPSPRGARQACLLEACETDRQLEADHLSDNSKFVLAFSAGASLATTVILSAVAVKEYLKK